MRYIDLFAGVGGFRYGIEAAFSFWNGQTTPTRSNSLEQSMEATRQGVRSGRDKSDALKPGVAGSLLDCVYSNEWDKYANSVYRRHYHECDNKDIRTVKASEIPDFDLLCGGFPCQSFSVAGRRGGFDDTRGTLFFEIARIVKEKRPRLLLLENVKGLLNHDQGRTFATILNTLAELGYDAQWQVFNSKDWGVPQNRERVYIVGHLGGTPRPQVFPITIDYSKDVEQSGVGEIAGTLDTGYARNHQQGHSTYLVDSQLKQVGNVDQKGHNSLWGRVYSPDGVSSTLNAHGGGLGARTGLYAVPVLTPQRQEKRQNGRRFKTDGEPAFTLNTQDQHGVYDGVSIRRLTPLECERLQGFPDNWTQYGLDEATHSDIAMSDTQRYKMMGNAVTTNVVTAIAERLLL